MPNLTWQADQSKKMKKTRKPRNKHSFCKTGQLWPCTRGMIAHRSLKPIQCMRGKSNPWSPHRVVTSQFQFLCRLRSNKKKIEMRKFKLGLPPSRSRVRFALAKVHRTISPLSANQLCWQRFALVQSGSPPDVKGTKQDTRFYGYTQQRRASGDNER